ncbi:MAG TPA: nitroreductase family protein [Thermoanaerobaculia bacterium]|jgi:SagB-type dehydrogenase family enzyme
MMNDGAVSPELVLASAAQPGAPTEELVRFWKDSRLRADQAKSTSVRSAPKIVPWRIALEDVLKIGYGVETQSRYEAGSWQQVRRLTTPSAGALYPFEVFACVVGEGSYLWDVEEERLVPCGLAALTAEDLAAAGLAAAPGQRLEALLVLVARPWVSMKKYFQRGYAYCHLDVGHLAANLAIYTAALGHGSALHLRFSHTALAGYLSLGGLCREPLAVLSFAAAKPAACPEPAAWSRAGQEPAALELPAEAEIRCWESLRGIRSFDCPLALPCPPANAPLLIEPAAVPEEDVVPLPIGRAQPSAAREWRAAILGRRSAKGFRAEPLSAAHVGELLGALRDEGFPSDFAGDASARLGVRLVARNVEGLEGVFAYAPRSHSLHRLDPQTGDPRPACMHQEIARNAAALIFLHAPISDLMAGQGYSAFSELHIQAGELAQRLYLAAARIGAVGMTCIGGFDDYECAALARLTDADETLYVILLGLPDEAAIKQDRLSVAYSHGHSTLQES